MESTNSRDFLSQDLSGALQAAQRFLEVLDLRCHELHGVLPLLHRKPGVPSESPFFTILLFVALDPRRAASFAVRRSRPDTPLRHSATTLTSTSIVGWTSRWSSTLCRQCRRRDCKDSCHDQTRSGTSASWTCPRAPIYAKA